MLDENLDRHHELIDEARGARRRPGRLPGARADRLPAPGPRRRGRDAPRRPAPRALAAATHDLSVVVSFVEESADHRLFIAAALLEDGQIRHVHRKLFLPTYGLFDERRFFAAGDLLRATPSRLGVGVGIAICEDFWHLTVPQLLALDGAQILINVSSSPGRDLAATNEVGLGTATSWRTLMRTYAQLTTDRGLLQPGRRRRVDLVLGRLGGDRAERRPLFGAPLFEEGLFTVDVPLADLRRERISLPLLRDERPELQVRELTRIVAERAGLAADSTADELAAAGLDVAPGDALREPIGFRPGGGR